MTQPEVAKTLFYSFSGYYWAFYGLFLSFLIIPESYFFLFLISLFKSVFNLSMLESSCIILAMKLKFNDQTKQRTIFIVAVLFTVVLMFRLYSQISKMNAFQNEAMESTKILAYYEETKSVLETEIGVIESNQVVDEWARVEGRYVQYGDIPIIILTPESATMNATPTPLVNEQDYSNPEAWRVWLFGFM
jgi:cell division protein FtsB